MPQQSGHHRKQCFRIPDLPPESFCVPREEAFDWYNQNAFTDRRGSMKLTLFGTTNSDFKPGSYDFHSPRSSSSFSLIPKSKKSSILALAETGRSCSGDAILRRKLQPGKGRLFRSRSESEIRPMESEPGSPRVSCMGKVRVKKDAAKRAGLWVIVRSIFMTRFRVNRVSNSRASSESNDMEFGPAGLGGPKQ